MDKLKTLLIKVALKYIKLYNLTEEDVIIINGYIEELLSEIGDSNENL